MLREAEHSSFAVDMAAANVATSTNCPSPSVILPRATARLKPAPRTGAAKPIPPARQSVIPMSIPPGDTELGGQSTPVDQSCCAPQYLSILIEQHRYRWQTIRARQRLELQSQGFCRRFCDGDKVQASKLWGAVKADPMHELRIWIEPFLSAMEPLIAAQTSTEKKLAKLAKALPVYDWAKGISGLGEVSLSAIVGECGAPVGEYKSVSAVWKRMGLAVINGERQRRVAGDAAIEHGYNPGRRSIMWNIGCCLIKAQVRKDPENEELRIGIGEYGALYLERKAYEATKTDRPIIAHARAQRYMEKRLLREMWKAWRAAA